MTIEKSPSPSANATSSASSANRSEGKGKTGTDDGSGGFGAILSAVDNAPATAEAATDSKSAKSAPDTTAVDPNTLLQQNPQIAAAQAQQVAADTATASAVAAGLHAHAAGTPAAVTDPATLAQQAAANLPQAGQGVASAASPLPGAARATVRGTPGVPDGTVALDTTASATPTAAQSLLQARAKSAREALQADAGTATQTGQTIGSTASQATGSERVDTAKFLAALQQAQSPQGNRAAETAMVPLVAQTDKPQTERSASSTAKSADPTYTGTALGVSGPDTSQTPTATGTVAPEMQVAEQVSYWVTHNVQNAELKLDGLGKDPVAVSISVQGNEAQITFRSDESATRDMLQASGSHLKDMLQREGLVLTGVSVDSSGSQSAQSRGEQGGRQNARQTTIAPLQSSQDSPARVRTGMAGNSGRSVDLFV